MNLVLEFLNNQSWAMFNDGQTQWMLLVCLTGWAWDRAVESGMPRQATGKAADAKF